MNECYQYKYKSKRYLFSSLFLSLFFIVFHSAEGLSKKVNLIKLKMYKIETTTNPDGFREGNILKHTPFRTK